MKRVASFGLLLLLLLTACSSKDEEMYAAFSATAQEIEAFDADWQENAMTQADINVACQASYEKWDALLNEIYQYLEESMPKEEFEALEEEELSWIAEKEAAIEAAGKEWQGGSGEAMARYGTAADYTQERCYTLLSYIAD